MVKNLPAGDEGEMGSIPGSGRSPGGGNGHPFQHFCLGNPMDRRAWWATVHGVAESQQSMGLQRVRHDQATEHILHPLRWMLSTTSFFKFIC